MAAPTKYTKVAHTVYTASEFGTWTERAELECLGFTHGNMARPGAARIVCHEGPYAQDGTIDVRTTEVTPGLYVKVTVASHSWYGVILGRRYERPDSRAEDGGGMVSFDCLEIIGLLDYIYPHRGHEYRGDGTALGQTGQELPFNAIAGGDRTTATVSGQYYHRRDASSATTWTETLAIQHLLALYADEFVYPPDGTITGPTWTFSGLDAAVMPPFDPHGKSLAEAINAVFNPSRGALVRFSSVVTTTIYFAAVNCSAVETVIGGTTRAAATPVAISFDGDEKIKDLTLEEGWIPYEVVFGFGARPFFGISLWYTYGDGDSILQPDGWTVSDTPSDEAGDEDHWHRFKIRSDWNGETYGLTGDGLPTDLEYGGTVPTGYPGYTGTTPNMRALQLVGDLPASEGWGTTKVGPRQKAVLVVGNATNGWRRLNLPMQFGTGYVVIGANRRDGWRLRALLADGTNTLILTCGARGWAPLTAAAMGDDGEYVRTMPNVLSIDVPDCEYWLMLDQTVKGVTTAKALSQYSAEATIRDDVPRMQSTVARARSVYGMPYGSLEWTKLGTLDFSNYRPGTLVNPATIHGVAHDVYAVVQWVDYDLTQCSTTWHAPRMRPGMRVQ